MEAFKKNIYLFVLQVWSSLACFCILQFLEEIQATEHQQRQTTIMLAFAQYLNAQNLLLCQIPPQKASCVGSNIFENKQRRLHLACIIGLSYIHGNPNLPTFYFSVTNRKRTTRKKMRTSELFGSTEPPQTEIRWDFHFGDGWGGGGWRASGLADCPN